MARSETVLGVDVGERRVGLAISEVGTHLAVPSQTVERGRAVLEIVKLVQLRDVSTIVVGWPVELTGRATRSTRRVERFESELRTGLLDAEVTARIVRVDERLSTVHANHLLSAAQIYGQRRKEVVDQVAAVQILESYLDLNDGSVSP